MAGYPSWTGVSTNSALIQFAGAVNNGSFGGAQLSLLSTEAHAQSPSVAGTWSRLGVLVRANTRSTTTTFRIRINGVNGNSLVSVGAGVTGFLVDTTNSDVVNDGDLVSWQSVNGGSSGAITLNAVSAKFVPTATVGSQLYRSSIDANSSAGNRLMALGHASGNSSLPNVPFAQYAPAAGTLKKLWKYTTANTAVGSTTAKTYINSTTGAATVTHAAAATGLQTDTTNTDSLVSGDQFYALVNAQNTTGYMGVWLETATTLSQVSSLGSRSMPSSGVTEYAPPFGELRNYTTEADAQNQIPFDATIKTLRIYYAVNNNSTPVTWTLRVNGVDTALAVTVPGTGTKTGLFTATGSVAVVAGDLISFKGAGANSSSTMNYIGVDIDSATGTTATVGLGNFALTGYSAGQTVSQAVGVGSLALSGKALADPSISTPVGPGTLVLTGQAAVSALAVSVGVGSLTFTGYGIDAHVPSIPRVSQFGAQTLVTTEAAVRSSQFGAHALAQTSTALRISQFGLNALVTTETRTRISQMGLLVLAKGGTPPLTPSPLSLAAAGRTKVIDSRIVNMYFEPTPDGPSRDARFGRPGLVVAAERGGGPVTANFDWQGFNFTVSGNSVWRDNENIGFVLAGDDTRYATSDTEIVIVTGGRAYYVTTTDVTPISDTDLPDPVIDVIQRTNGRFVYLGADGRWYYSEVGDARTIDPLSFNTADQAPDNLMAAINVGDSFVLFGKNSGEWWYDTGDNDAPFQRSNGRAYRKGLAARQTLVEADNAGFFLGSDRVVYRMAADPQRVSTYDIEDAIRRVPDADLPDAWAFSTYFGGHTWYVLSLPGQSTWAFDISQNKWQEWKTWNKPNFRVRTANGAVLGDQYSGKIMSFDQHVYTDVDDPLERVIGVYLPVKSGNAKNWNLMLGALRGVGLPTGYGSQPVVEMRYSDGDGRVWSNWMEAPLGVMGDFGEGAKAIWDQLGSVKAPGRLYEFRVTDPVEFTPYIVKYNEVRP